ncbi:hypothetical protein C8R45DRAFT_919293 [Mycena sanguinolenta]|nr:hypothetical protein C8R45DRAFT_919293 [Mycena sanguinolenta]
MTTFPTTAASTAVADRAEIMAVLATVDEESPRHRSPSRPAGGRGGDPSPYAPSPPFPLSPLTDASLSGTWTAGTPRTPAQVAAEHANVAEGSRSLWVVFVRREPGVYTTIESADLQIKGVPNQQYRRKSSKSEALQFYREKYDAGQVQK